MTLAPFSPEWLAKIEHLAHDSRDDFWLGAQWMLDQLNEHQPPEIPGASSRQEADQ